MHVSKEIDVLQSSSFPEATTIFKSDQYRLALILLFWHLAHILKKINIRVIYKMIYLIPFSQPLQNYSLI